MLYIYKKSTNKISQALNNLDCPAESIAFVPEVEVILEYLTEIPAEMKSSVDYNMLQTGYVFDREVA